MITDDHKTPMNKTSASVTSAMTDGGVSAASSRAGTASVRSKRSSRVVREPSASTDDERKPSLSGSFKKLKHAKPYDRKASSDIKSPPSTTGPASPRASLGSTGLSMTPWSADVPLVNPQFVSSQVPGLGEVGSGAISPSLVMSGGVAYDGQTQWPQQGSSPSGLSSALPNISHQLSQWANNNNEPGTPFSDSELAYNTNLMMQLDEQPWQYGVQDRAPNTGGPSAFAQQINPTNHMTFNLQPPQFGLRNDNHGNRNVNNFGHTEMAQQSVSMLVNLCIINEFLTFGSNSLCADQSIPSLISSPCSISLLKHHLPVFQTLPARLQICRGRMQACLPYLQAWV